MSVCTLIQPGAVGPEVIAAAVRELGCVAQPEVMREIIAGRIIAAARFSERDPARLRTAALAGREND
jgi:hypothetical protein